MWIHESLLKIPKTTGFFCTRHAAPTLIWLWLLKICHLVMNEMG